jgi:hypothetical protein
MREVPAARELTAGRPLPEPEPDAADAGSIKTVLLWESTMETLPPFAPDTTTLQKPTPFPMVGVPKSAFAEPGKPPAR